MKDANAGKDSIGWDMFKYLVGNLVPRTLKEKIDLFLEAFTPSGLRNDEIENYEFSQTEIHDICTSCLAPIFA